MSVVSKCKHAHKSNATKEVCSQLAFTTQLLKIIIIIIITIIIIVIIIRG